MHNDLWYALIPRKESATRHTMMVNAGNVKTRWHMSVAKLSATKNCNM